MSDTGVISRKKMIPNTMGLMIFPSNIPNPYQSRFKGASNCGDESVTIANKRATIAATRVTVLQPSQYAYAVRVVKPAAKTQPNVVLLGSCNSKPVCFDMSREPITIFSENYTEAAPVTVSPKIQRSETSPDILRILVIFGS